MISTANRDEFVGKLRQLAKDNDLWWHEPLISMSGNCLEWWHGNRKLTVYLENWGIDCLATYGDNTDEMAYPYDADFSSLWRWIDTP